MVRPLLVATSDLVGGAGRATHRLYCGLREEGVNPQMIVDDKRSADTAIYGLDNRLSVLGRKIVRLLDPLPVKIRRSATDALWTFNYLPRKTAKRINASEHDIINLHWTGRGFLPIYDFKYLRAPLVWTMHDMWALTGGCHYDQDCERYQARCGACPQLSSNQEIDITRLIWKLKHREWNQIEFTVVTPSQWLASCVKASSLFRDSNVQVIPNGIDIELFKPINRKKARSAFGLPQEKLLVLFGTLGGTTDPRKGFDYLKTAINHLTSIAKDLPIELVVLGAERTSSEPQLGLPIHYTGILRSDQKLVDLYSACDVFVAASTQDNLPNSVMEALACGTPCVAFNIGGMPDMIEHKHNGYLAQPFSSDDLAVGIRWVLADESRRKILGKEGRKKVEDEFTMQRQAQRYIELYESILHDNPSRDINDF